jgi:hypothetical protein
VERAEHLRGWISLSLFLSRSLSLSLSLSLSGPSDDHHASQIMQAATDKRLGDPEPETLNQVERAEQHLLGWIKEQSFWISSI